MSFKKEKSYLLTFLIKSKQLKISLFFVLSLILFFEQSFSQGVAVNTVGSVADASAILDVSSVNSGILIPRMLKSQKNAINLPAEGLMIYQIDDTTGFWFFNGIKWELIGVNSGSNIAPGSNSGNTLYWDGNNWIDSPNIFNLGGSVGINTSNPEPSAYLDISGTSKGFLMPRMTNNERNAIASPADGLQIFNTDSKCVEIFISGAWHAGFCGFICGINSVYDSRDGQSYQTVKIGSQCWMKENLNYNQNSYGNDWCYDNDINNCNIYGRLYDWAAAMAGSTSSSTNPSGVQGVCPDGWHLPSDDEWKQLEKFLGMSQVDADATVWRGTDEGDKLKETGTLHWPLPNTGATNSSGFTALPGGFRNISGSFINIANEGYWWLSDDFDGVNAWCRLLAGNNSKIYRGAFDKADGFSVRCVRD